MQNEFRLIDAHYHENESNFTLTIEHSNIRFFYSLIIKKNNSQMEPVAIMHLSQCLNCPTNNKLKYFLSPCPKLSPHLNDLFKEVKKMPEFRLLFVFE